MKVRLKETDVLEEDEDRLVPITFRGEWANPIGNARLFMFEGDVIADMSMDGEAVKNLGEERFNQFQRESKLQVVVQDDKVVALDFVQKDPDPSLEVDGGRSSS